MYYGSWNCTALYYALYMYIHCGSLISQLPIPKVTVGENSVLGSAVPFDATPLLFPGHTPPQLPPSSLEPDYLQGTSRLSPQGKMQVLLYLSIFWMMDWPYSVLLTVPNAASITWVSTTHSWLFCYMLHYGNVYVFQVSCCIWLSTLGDPGSA